MIKVICNCFHHSPNKPRREQDAMEVLHQANCAALEKELNALPELQGIDYEFEICYNTITKKADHPIFKGDEKTIAIISSAINHSRLKSALGF